MSLVEELNRLTEYEVRIVREDYSGCYQLNLTDGTYVVNTLISRHTLENMNEMKEIVQTSSKQIDDMYPYKNTPLYKALNE